MKKIFLITVLAISGTLLSCGGNVQTESKEPTISVATTTASSNLSEKAMVKVENGKIIPVNDKPTIVDFYATWCGPCKQLEPIFKKLEEKFKDRINFIRIDVDENINLSQSYGIQSVPTIIFLNKDGQIQSTIVGFRNEDQLLSAINSSFGF